VAVQRRTVAAPGRSGSGAQHEAWVGEVRALEGEDERQPEEEWWIRWPGDVARIRLQILYLGSKPAQQTSPHI